MYIYRYNICLCLNIGIIYANGSKNIHLIITNLYHHFNSLNMVFEIYLPKNI